MTPVSLGELADRLAAELHGDPSVEVTGISTPRRASCTELALLTDPERLEEGRRSLARAFVVSRRHDSLSGPQIICEDPSRALGLLLDHFDDDRQATPGCVDPRAAVSDDAVVDEGAWIGPFAFVGAGARIDALARVEPFAYVGAGARVGARCHLGPGSTLAAGCVLEEGVVVGPGAVIGFRGFGFWRDEEGWRPIPSRGAVHIAADVEIGANTCVDAGTLAPTTIGAGAKIDNLVQVGHNAEIDRRALLCAQVGLAGSVALAEDCILGGQAGIADHRRVGRRSRVGAHSGVARDVPDDATVSGYPSIPQQRWLRASVTFPRLGEMARQIKELRLQVAALFESLRSAGLTDRGE